MKFCLSLAEKDPRHLRMLMQRHSRDVELIEVRLDHLEQPELTITPPQGAAEFIATCRPAREGGRFQGSESQRLAILQKAAHSGFDFIDLEYDVATPAGLPSKLRVIRSRHIWEGFPEDFRLVFPAGDRPGDVSKLAVSVSNTPEAVRVLEWMASDSRCPGIVIGMGRYGQITRYLGFFLGNPWTYICLEEDPVAPGQFALSQALEYFGSRLSPAPLLFGVLGNPVSHSLSPRLHNRLFRQHAVDGVYLPLEVEDLECFLDFVDGASLEFRGFSVTMPHKLAAAKWLDSSGASPLRPINTLIDRAGRWSGANTDLEGFLRPLERRTELQGRQVVILGSGGVAHTAVEALQSRNADPIVVGRREAPLRDLARQYGCQTRLWSELPASGQILVNATPVGQFPDPDASPWPGNSLDFEIVYDLIYRPRKTLLLAAAEKAGARIISGSEMFLEQAALQFQAWTGIEPDRAVMMETLKDN